MSISGIALPLEGSVPEAAGHCFAAPPYGVEVPSYGVKAPSDGVKILPFGVKVSPYGVEGPPYGFKAQEREVRMA